jgi:riboflavin transporter FmnP
MTPEQLKQISPDISLMHKSLIKLPMILILVCAGFMTGFNLTFLKYVGVLIVNGHIEDHWVMALLMLLATGISAIGEVVFINWSMRFYD